MRARALVVCLLVPLGAGVVAAHPARRAATETPANENLEAIAASFARLQKWDQAIELYDEARVSRPDDPDLFEDLINACIKSQRCAQRRLGLIREGLVRLPRPGDLVDALVDELQRLGRGAQILDELAKYLARHGDDDEARALYIDAAEGAHRPDLALRALPAYLARRPSDIERRVLYVELLHKLHRLDEANRQIESLVRAFPESVSVVVLCGQADLERGDLIAANERLARARALAAQHHAADDEERVRELERDLAAARHEQYAEFRDEAAWLDAAEDLQREQDRVH